MFWIRHFIISVPLFSSCSPTKTILIQTLYATCPAHLPILDFIPLTMFVEEHQLHCHQPPVTSLRSKYSPSDNLISFRQMTDQYSTTGKITVSCILISWFLYRTREVERSDWSPANEFWTDDSDVQSFGRHWGNCFTMQQAKPNGNCSNASSSHHTTV